MEMDNDELLPEDCSIFKDISMRSDNVSSDALVEDGSFSRFLDTSGPFTSTPSKPTSSNSPVVDGGDSPRRSPRLASRQSSCSSPSQPSTSASSPRRSSRLSRSQSPAALPKSPACLPQSTAGLPRGRGRSKGSDSSACRPSKEIVKPPSRFKCPKCPATLANKQTLDTHLRGHLMKGITSRAPSLSELNGKMQALILDAIESIRKEKVIGDISKGVNNYCQIIINVFEGDDDLLQFLSESFHEIIQKEKVLFPSAIRSTFLIGTNKLLSSSEFREKLQRHFGGFENCDEGVMNVFIGDFTTTLCDKIMVFCMRKMRSGLDAATSNIERKKRSSDSVESVEFKQLVYHISGSVINGFLWKGKQYSKTSKTWGKYVSALKNNCLASDDNKCSEEVRHFSDKKDRGGYKHINDDTFSFFSTVFDLLMSKEGEDGSLPANVIDETILASDTVLCLWDVLMGNDLTADESLDLLIQIVQSSIKVVMKGILKRRLNEHLKQSYNSVAMRARLAAKK